MASPAAVSASTCRSPEPTDPGVAFYFHLTSQTVVLACDRYHTVAANMAAIAARIAATRTIERHGVGTIQEMFTGFLALPDPGNPPWRVVLGFRPDQAVTRETIQARRRGLARLHHPDAGGDADRMARISAAADDALKEIGRG